jgi:hypothetical protein
MKYTYTAAWAVIGGINLREESRPIELASTENARFILTRDPDSLLAGVDESFAVGRLMLKGLVGRGPEGFQTALASEVEEIKAERKKKVGTHVVLLFQAIGEIVASVREPLHENDMFIVTFDTFEKNRVRQLHQTDIDAMKIAVAFETDAPARFAYVTDGAYLLNDEGKPIYSNSFSIRAEASFSTPLSNEAVTRIAARYAALNQENDLDAVERLFSQMAEYNTDRLKAFLSGWAAIEILIAKSFKNYEQAFLSPFTNAEQQTLRERFLARIKGVMKDKYRLTDKFIAVTAVLFPSIEDVEAEKNYTDFCRLKGLRDSIFHGEPFSEIDLPVHELAALLRKYVVARIATPNKALNAGAPACGKPVRQNIRLTSVLKEPGKK